MEQRAAWWRWAPTRRPIRPPWYTDDEVEDYLRGWHMGQRQGVLALKGAKNGASE